MTSSGISRRVLTEVSEHRGARTAVQVAILADDLIWATRLSDAVAAAGGVPMRVRRLGDLETLLAGGSPPFVIVDLTARAYDGVEASRSASAAGAKVVAGGQHDDALAAGAERVYAYRKLFEDGPRTLGAWLAG